MPTSESKTCDKLYFGLYAAFTFYCFKYKYVLPQLATFDMKPCFTYLVLQVGQEPRLAHVILFVNAFTDFINKDYLILSYLILS